ncbi:hypothetical protein GLV94_05310 [Virgibacillus halodenitrificans]|uniref:hypothetical protein n=1 Tax=Virgibacillus halodenitrificans TaxID=1482 RepID=UPI00136BE7FB|nr:hypothetical protein [Virgibacillus halodenitrificans]MYL45053.1 hypothetical protein [Virgibacillus halodenitrificans]
MRHAIRTKLLTDVPDFNDVYEPHAAGPDSVKPYGVIRQGVDTEESDWMGFRRIVEVWPYVSRSTFTKVDSLQSKIIDALDQKLITDSVTGEVFSCVYLGTVGQDVTDDEWDAITRGLRFAVMAIQQVEQPINIKSDPWITALANWSSGFLDASWTVYENQLPLGYKRPCVLWRLDNYEAKGVSRSVYKVTKNVVGHVISTYPNQKIHTSSEIVERLMSEIKVPISIQERRYMTVSQPRSDFRADGLNTGQINVRLSRKSRRMKEDFPLMQDIQSTGAWR